MAVTVRVETEEDAPKASGRHSGHPSREQVQFETRAAHTQIRTRHKMRCGNSKKVIHNACKTPRRKLRTTTSGDIGAALTETQRVQADVYVRSRHNPQSHECAVMPRSGDPSLHHASSSEHKLSVVFNVGPCGGV